MEILELKANIHLKKEVIFHYNLQNYIPHKATTTEYIWENYKGFETIKRNKKNKILYKRTD